MPYAIFRYDAEEEFSLRASVTGLMTRLQNKGKRITTISLAECLQAAMEAERPLAEWCAAEETIGLEEYRVGTSYSRRTVTERFVESDTKGDVSGLTIGNMRL